MKKRHSSVIFLIVLFSIFYTGKSYAQHDRTIDLMESIPQSNYTNPSQMPMGKWYFGFPALSSFNFAYSNTAFKYLDAVHHRGLIDDSLMLDPQRVLNQMHKRNYIGVDLSEEILSFGFKAAKRKLFFNFSVTEKASARFCLPRDMFHLLWKGNGDFVDENKKADFKWFGLNEVHYHEISLGIAKTLSPKFTVGGHVKLLVGLSNVRFRKSDISLYTDGSEDLTYDLTGNSNVEVYTSVPGMTIYKNDTGYNKFDSLKFDFDPKTYFKNFNNKGIAVDLGATFKLNDKFSFSASVLDLGGIKWKTNVQNFKDPNASVTFDGVDIVSFLYQPDSVRNQLIQDMTDSLTKHFDLVESKESYWSPLSTKIFVTGTYTINEKNKIGLLVREDFFNRTAHQSFTATYNRKFASWLYLTVSASYFNRTFTNVGAGLAILGGPFEFYAASDNVMGAIWPENFRNVPIHFGMNFIFGYKTPKENKAIL